MARLLAIYKTPADTAAFDAYYFGSHVPLAKTIPGLRKYEVNAGPVMGMQGPSSTYLVATLHFMVRYIHVLGDELGRMTQARRARSFRRSGVDYGILTGLIGVLFVRAMERGERVHSAMLARGWDGTIRTLDDEPSEAPG